MGTVILVPIECGLVTNISFVINDQEMLSMIIYHLSLTSLMNEMVICSVLYLYGCWHELEDSEHEYLSVVLLDYCSIATVLVLQVS